MLAAAVPGLINCRKCRRLADFMAALPPKRGRKRQDYWNRPVPGFGDPAARVCLVGLAPGAHGANCTGRPFTGDGAGDFMYPLLYEAGFSNQPEATSRDDGLVLKDLYLTNAVKCLPPDNKPIATEFHACRNYLVEELDSLPHLKVILALGGDAFRSLLQLYRDRGELRKMSEFSFAHGAVYRFEKAPILVGSYHTSRYNIQTGRLTTEMFRGLLRTVQQLVAGDNC